MRFLVFVYLAFFGLSSSEAKESSSTDLVDFKNELHGYTLKIPKCFKITGFADEEATKSNLVEMTAESCKKSFQLLDIKSPWTNGTVRGFTGLYNRQNIQVNGQDVIMSATVDSEDSKSNPSEKRVSWYLNFNCNKADLILRFIESYPVSQVDEKNRKITGDVPSKYALDIVKSFRCLKGSYWSKNKKTFYQDQ